MHQIAAKQLVETGAIDLLGGHCPGRRQELADRGLGLLGQKQTAKSAGRIGQGRGDGVVAIQPHRAFGCVRRMARGLVLAGPMRLAAVARFEPIALRPLRAFELIGPALGFGAFPCRCLPPGAGLKAPLRPRLLLVPRCGLALMVAVVNSAVALMRGWSRARATRPKRPRRSATGSPIGAAAGRRLRRAAGAIAMRRFHFSLYSPCPRACTGMTHVRARLRTTQTYVRAGLGAGRACMPPDASPPADTTEQFRRTTPG